MKNLGRLLFVVGLCGLITLGVAYIGCDSGPKNVDKDEKPEELQVPLIEDETDDEDADTKDAELSAPKN